MLPPVNQASARFWTCTERDRTAEGSGFRPQGAILEIERGGCCCHSPLMSATVDSFFDEYARLYTERDVEGVTNLCLWPFLATRRGEVIHMPDRKTVRDHFASAIAAYRVASGAGSGRRSRSTLASSASTRSSPPCTGMPSTRTGRWSETPGRATSCSPLRTGGASSRTRITSERSRLRRCPAPPGRASLRARCRQEPLTLVELRVMDCEELCSPRSAQDLSNRPGRTRLNWSSERGW
jgi:hypothetical protein